MDSIITALSSMQSTEKENTKDDNTPISRAAFGMLAAMTLGIASLALYNGYLLARTGRLKRNLPLALFQFFSVLTLISMIDLDM